MDIRDDVWWERERLHFPLEVEGDELLIRGVESDPRRVLATNILHAKLNIYNY